jgi:hypothetical protein
MGEGGAAVQESAGYKSMQKTKWMTLTGSVLAVLSSSVLYVNIIAFLFLGGSGSRWWNSPYLHYQVFGLNLDSVLNDVGMLLACGMLKQITFGPVQGAAQRCLTKFRTFAAHKVEVEPGTVKSRSYHSKSGSGSSSSSSCGSNSSSSGSETEADGQPVIAHFSKTAACRTSAVTCH